MYSYEDRLRAVRLYIKLGKRVGLTIRQLGYPTKNALKHWHRQYEQRFDLSASYVRWPKYSQSQKELAVEHYLEHGRCLAATIKALGYPSRTLLPAWAQELHPETHTCVVVRTQELAHFLILMSQRSRTFHVAGRGHGDISVPQASDLCVFQPIVDGRFRRSWTAFQTNVDAISG